MLWQGDITRLRVDAIVNAANSQMLGCFLSNHNCIDNIEQTMAGVEMRYDCYKLMQAQGHDEPTGKAKISVWLPSSRALRPAHGRSHRAGQPDR